MPHLLQVAAILSLVTCDTHAQTEKKNPASAREVEGELMLRPDPYAKLIALDAALGEGVIKWSEVINRTQVDFDADAITDKTVAMPALLGFRICDGVMAIRARDAEKLNACAEDIEKISKKLGVKDSDLKRAKMVRSFANSGEWTRVFLELGYLQMEIENVLQRESNGTGKAPVRKILYAAGWLQGARYTSNLVKDNYNAKTAGILREPLLVKALKKDLDQAGLPNTGIMKLLSDALGELEKLVNVGIHQPLSQESVEAMAGLTSKTVVNCLKSAE